MKLRFTIRDLLWLVAFVAVWFGWQLDRIKNEDLKRQNSALQQNQLQVDQLKKDLEWWRVHANLEAAPAERATTQN